MNGLNHILVSKLEIPRAVPFSAERHSLLETLSGCRERILVIQGKAGYGKTELARQYCRMSGKKIIWYSLNEADNEVFAFLSYLKLALTEGDYREECKELGGINWDRPEESEWIIDTVHKIRLSMKQLSESPALLVLDSFEVIRNEDIFRLLQHLLRHSSRKLQILFVSRYQMPDFFYQYVVSGECKVIDEAALAFTREEQLIKISSELNMDKKEAENILDQFLYVAEGWPSCLTLALICIQKRGMKKKDLNWEYFIHDSMIFSFLSYEIFDKHSEEVKKFLIQISVLSKVDIEALDQILNITNSKAIINQLIKESLIVSKTDSNYGKLCFPNIIGVFLNSMAENKMKKELLERAAQYYFKKTEYSGERKQTEDISLTDNFLKTGLRETEPGKKLVVKTFGDFSVTVIEDKKALSWRTKKGSELFAYLVELDGQAVGRRLLLQKLWEDDMPDNAVSMLHNMLYNIRKELAACHINDLIRYKDKMYSINMNAIETDWREIRYICRLVDKEQVQELIKYSPRFQLYWGRYLEDMDCQWAMEQREYYDTRFLKGCDLLADFSMREKDYENALVYLKNALIINTYSEEIMCSLLKCCGHLRNLKQAKGEYERFCTLLERDLDIEPGAELRETYQIILNSRGKGGK